MLSPGGDLLSSLFKYVTNLYQDGDVMKCPGCGSEMEEKKSYPNTPGLSTIKTRETCPKCGKTFNLDTVAYFENAEKKR